MGEGRVLVVPAGDSPSSTDMAEQAVEWVGVRVTPTQKAKIERRANHKGGTQKAAVLEAVEHELSEDDAVEVQLGPALEKIADLVDVEPDSEAPTDLSTNPEHNGGLWQRLTFLPIRG